MHTGRTDRPEAERQRAAFEGKSIQMMQRLLVASPLDVVGSPNSRTHHLVRHLALHFRETFVISRANNSHRSRWEQWSALLRMRTIIQDKGRTRWISLSPWGNVRHGLGLHLLGLASPYTVPASWLRRALRRVLSSLGLIFELGIFPSLVLGYVFRVRRPIDVFIGEGPWEILLGLLLQALGQARLVIYDDIDYQPGFQPISGLRRWIISRLEWFGIRRADVVISVGERLASLRRAQGGHMVQVIPNGVDVERFRAAYLARVVYGPRRPTLIYMGYLGAWGGLDLILDAAALAALKIPDLRVILLGHGAPLDLSALREGILQRGLEGTVEFRGEVAYNDLPAHLAEADIGLAMFRPLDLTRYAFPLKVVEYMAAGLPVMATEDTEAADLVTLADAGEAVPFNAPAAALRIIALLQDRERHRRYAKNAGAFSKAYDWNAVMAQYAAALEDCLRNRGLAVEQALRVYPSSPSRETSRVIRARDEKLQ